MKKLVPIVCYLATLAVCANAQLLNETFTYPDGPLVGAPGSPWTTSSGTAGQQNVISGRLFLDDNETEDTLASLSSAVTSGILTATFDLQIDPGDIPSSGAGEYFTHFVANSGAQIGRVFTLTNPGGPAGTFRLAVATTGGTPVVLGTFMSGTTYSISLSYDFSTDLASLSAIGFGSVTATDAVDTPSINRYGFRQQTTTGDIFIDNLAVVPEPATYVLFGLGVLICAQQFRKRKQN